MVRVCIEGGWWVCVVSMGCMCVARVVGWGVLVGLLLCSPAGHNGAGKTTTINMLIGLLAPDQGTYMYIVCMC